MSKFKEMIGQKFERLTVIEEFGRTKHNKILWRCECDCGSGRLVIVATSSLTSGNTKSCGCIKQEGNHKTHGLYKHPLYKVWKGIISRCYNQKQENYKLYGGRGIVIYDKWKDSFENFYNDVIEGYEEGLELDRVDNNGNYEPNNVRWVTTQQNKCNTRSHINSSSKYKGVSWNKRLNKWISQIQINNKKLHIGCFEEEIDAAIAYNEKAKELFGEYAYLNSTE